MASRVKTTPAPPSVPRAVGSQEVATKEQMLAAGVPEAAHGAVPMFDSLEEAAEALNPAKPDSDEAPLRKDDPSSGG